MTAQEIEAIAGGYHGDAFRILGPHSVRKKGNQPRWEVRAFLPHAETAEVAVGGQRCPMTKKHAAGSSRPCRRGPRTVPHHARLWDGREVDLYDPYRFPILISDSTSTCTTKVRSTKPTAPLERTGPPARGFTECASRVGGNAENVSLAGDFNEWDTRRHPMRKRNGGVWEIFMPEMASGPHYKYHIRSRLEGYQQLKADPYAFFSETPPKSAVEWFRGRLAVEGVGIRLQLLVARHAKPDVVLVMQPGCPWGHEDLLDAAIAFPPWGGVGCPIR